MKNFHWFIKYGIQKMGDSRQFSLIYCTTKYAQLRLIPNPTHTSDYPINQLMSR